MVCWGPVRTIFAKELRETVRDRRTVFAMFVLPMLLYPLLAYLALAIGEREVTLARTSTSRVAMSGDELPALRERLETVPELVVLPGNLDGAAAHRTADVEVFVATGGSERLRGEKSVAVELRWDATSESSSLAVDRVEASIQAWEEELRTARLEAHGLAGELWYPFSVEIRNTAPPERVGGSIMGRIVPFLLLMMVMIGAFYPAIDLTVGEKERGTLETLLASPVMPSEVVAGKFLAVTATAVATGAVNLLSIGLTVWAILSQASTAGVELTVALSPGVLAALGVSLVLVGVFFAALMMAVATPARSVKEAQAYVTPVYLACVVPGFIATLPGMDLGYAMALVPVLGVALLVKALLVEEVVMGPALVSVVAAAAYATVALVVAARLFGRESVLFGAPAREPEEGEGEPRAPNGPRISLWGRAGWSASTNASMNRPDAKTETETETESDQPGSSSGGDAVPPPTGKRAALTAPEAYLLALGAVVLLVTLGAVLQGTLGAIGFVVTEWVLLIGPVLLAVWLLRLEPRTALNLGGLDGWALGGAILVGCTAWYPALLASFALGPLIAPDPEVLRTMSEAVRAPGEAWVTLAVFAITPAICEELLFRGALLSAFGRTHRPWVAILIVAALFGAFHLSIFRMVPTFVLGVAFGYVAYRAGSVFASMICHGINNGLVVLVTTLAAEPEVPEDFDMPDMPVPWIAGVVLIAGLGAGVAMLMRSKRGFAGAIRARG